MNGYIIKQASSVGTQPRSVAVDGKADRARPRLGHLVRVMGVALGAGALRLTG